ncbi:chondroitin AC/alginate lyase [Ceratobasidium sp. AG-I]|nr:chondroitin AC/alginate lyase [Ceratobasidium sp. AG-I]
MVKYSYSGLAAVVATFVAPVLSMTSYPNEFFAPDDVLDSSWVANAKWAQANTIEDAQFVAAQGPWTVTTKPILPPTNNSHDYLSLRPYFWPDCSNVGNTTELTQAQIQTMCTYVRRDGLFNPDARMVNDTGAFQAMTDSIFYNALAWSFNKDATYSTNIATAVNTWFINPDTLMNPNLIYAQLLRGPGVQEGSHTGILDLKCMSKLASGVLLLRKGQSAEWTSALDDGLNAWSKQYITWLTTDKMALEEKAAPNNHGSFYFTQLAALQVIVGDLEGAKATINEFFTGIYQDQISANGDQPLETDRTRPYHYRAYNLAAMTVNAKIGTYAGLTDAWNRTTKSGAGIQQACDYAMTLPATGEEDYVKELFAPLATVASVYGDPDGKYAAFLKSKDPLYPGSGYYLLAKGLSDSGLTQPTSTPTAGQPATTGTSNTSNGAGKLEMGAAGMVVALGAAFVSLF